MWNRKLGPLYPFIFIFSLLLAFLSTARLVHTFIFYDHLNSYYQLVPILLNGARIDLVVMAYFFCIPILLYTILYVFYKPAAKYLSKSLIYWAVAISLIIIFFELITPFYMTEYGVRPERKFFEYLTDPKEVFLMLWGMYGFLSIVILAILAVSAPFIYRLIHKSFLNLGDWSIPKFLVLFPVIVLVLFMCARSSFDHRPINPSMVAFTDDVLANTLPLNSLYSVMHAVYRLKDEANASDIYGDLERDAVFKYVRNEYEEHNSHQFNSSPNSNPEKKHKNLVIILEESLGARFVERLGGEALTPNLNKLAEQGWWFNHLYATGTRSVRGIEAVVTGFLPTPGRSVVKLSNSQSGFFTLASLLRQYGYQSQFYYGGNAHFDNMKGFFLGNGFHKVIEQKDFIDPQYVGSWGVSDEDVFQRMHEDLLQNTVQPQFLLVLTTSNHTPFDFPVDQDEHYQNPLKSRENAIRYADKALGKFINKAKKASYWEHTNFLIVADHDLRVSDFIVKTDPHHPKKNIKYFPVEGFHIPGLILGGGVQAKQIDTVASQIDLPPTLLSMLAIKANHPMIGTDLTMVDDSYVGRAIMQFNDHQAYLKGDSLVVLRPGQPPLKGKYINSVFTPMDDSSFEGLSKTALAHALWANIMYKDKSYN